MCPEWPQNALTMKKVVGPEKALGLKCLKDCMGFSRCPLRAVPKQFRLEVDCVDKKTYGQAEQHWLGWEDYPGPKPKRICELWKQGL